MGPGVLPTRPRSCPRLTHRLAGMRCHSPALFVSHYQVLAGATKNLRRPGADYDSCSTGIQDFTAISFTLPQRRKTFFVGSNLNRRARARKPSFFRAEKVNLSTFRKYPMI
jgi:hypothetical protein